MSERLDDAGKIEPEDRIAPNLGKQKRFSIDKQAAELEAQGIRLNRIPEGIYPGMPYLTPKELIKAGLTHYTHQHLLYLSNRGQIPGHKIAGNTIFDTEDIRALQDFESNSLNEYHGARRPGSRKK